MADQINRGAYQRNDALPKIEEGEFAPEDFYYEGPYIVFTESYHLKRGYCCNSDCRHCPFKEMPLSPGR